MVGSGCKTAAEQLLDWLQVHNRKPYTTITIDINCNGAITIINQVPPTSADNPVTSELQLTTQIKFKCCIINITYNASTIIIFIIGYKVSTYTIFRINCVYSLPIFHFG